MSRNSKKAKVKKKFGVKFGGGAEIMFSGLAGGPQTDTCSLRRQGATTNPKQTSRSDQNRTIATGIFSLKLGFFSGTTHYQMCHPPLTCHPHLVHHHPLTSHPHHCATPTDTPPTTVTPTTPLMCQHRAVRPPQIVLSWVRVGWGLNISGGGALRLCSCLEVASVVCVEKWSWWWGKTMVCLKTYSLYLTMTVNE